MYLALWAATLNAGKANAHAIDFTSVYWRTRDVVERRAAEEKVLTELSSRLQKLVENNAKNMCAPPLSSDAWQTCAVTYCRALAVSTTIV